MEKKPITTLYTKRLYLRPFKLGDEIAMYNNWESDLENTKYLYHKAHDSIEQSKRLVEIFIEETNSLKQYIYAICIKGNDEPIGTIGLSIVDERDEKASLGYVISKKHWNKGYMTEVLQSVITFAFEQLNLNRVEGEHAVDNVASGEVMIKCGMKREGLLREYYKPPQLDFQDVYIYSILRSDYKGVGNG